MERFAKEGFEVNSEETIFRCGFFEEGVLTESFALYVVSVMRFFLPVGPSFTPPSGRFRFPNILEFLPYC